MTAQSFTPGPWEAHVMTREVSVESDCGRVLFLVSRECDLETIADAHLIAAAPDLLEALQTFVDKYELFPGGYLGMGLTNGDFFAARAAIAKARGEVK